MAIVFALLIVGWLVAFALGNQVGFSNQTKQEASPTLQANADASATYRKPASAA